MFNKKQRQNPPDHRLADNLSEFAMRYEMPHSVDPSGLRAKMGIHVGEREPLTAHYQFDPSGDRYWVGAAERKVNGSEQANVERRIMSSPPIPGMIERVINDRLVVMSSRDGLVNRSNIEIQRCFQDDVARFATHYRQTKNILDKK